MSNSDQIKAQLGEFFQKIEGSNELAALKIIGAAISKVLSEEKAELSADLYKNDLLPLWKNIQTKASSLKDAGINVFSYLKDSKAVGQEKGGNALFEKFKSDGLGLFSKVTGAVSEFVVEVPKAGKKVIAYVDKVHCQYGEIATDEEKARYLIKVFLYSSVFAYAFWEGNKLPDSDFKMWGAGAHRSFLSHSVAPFLVIAGALLVLNRILERSKGHINGDKEALEIINLVQTLSKIFGIGLGAGMTTHLVIDGLWQTGGTIRIHDLNGNVLGSIVPGTRIDDMAYTTAMGLFTHEATTSFEESA